MGVNLPPIYMKNIFMSVNKTGIKRPPTIAISHGLIL